VSTCITCALQARDLIVTLLLKVIMPQVRAHRCFRQDRLNEATMKVKEADRFHLTSALL